MDKTFLQKSYYKWQLPRKSQMWSIYFFYLKSGEKSIQITNFNFFFTFLNVFAKLQKFAKNRKTLYGTSLSSSPFLCLCVFSISINWKILAYVCGLFKILKKACVSWSSIIGSSKRQELPKQLGCMVIHMGNMQSLFLCFIKRKVL